MEKWNENSFFSQINHGWNDCVYTSENNYSKFAKINRLMKLCKVLWAEKKGHWKQCEGQGMWEELGVVDAGEAGKKARGCFLKELHLLERGQEESQGETWHVIVVNLGERWWYA